MKNFILSLVAMLVVSTSFSQTVTFTFLNTDREPETLYYASFMFEDTNAVIEVLVTDIIEIKSNSCAACKYSDILTGNTGSNAVHTPFIFNDTLVDLVEFEGEFYGNSVTNENLTMNPYDGDTLSFNTTGSIYIKIPNGMIKINIVTSLASVHENEIQITALNAYPNPVVDYLNVEFETELSEVEVSVMNGAGQTIFIDNEMRWNGSNKVVVPMSDQPNGLYFVRIGNETRKIIKQ